jgi:hypothetical protein
LLLGPTPSKNRNFGDAADTPRSLCNEASHRAGGRLESLSGAGRAPERDPRSSDRRG